MIELLDLSWPLIALLLLSMSLAGLVHGALGLGFPMVATPLIAIFFDVRMAILFTLLPTIAVNLATIAEGKTQGDNIRRFAKLILFCLAGAICGAWLLIVMDPNPFRALLAILIVVYLFIDRREQLPLGARALSSDSAMVGFGFVAGFAGGTTNVMVAILLIYFLSLQLPRSRMLPVLNSCFLVGKLAQIGVFSLTGMLNWSAMTQTVPLALVALLALLCGRRVRRHISVQWYKRLLSYLLMLLAFILLLQFYQHL